MPIIKKMVTSKFLNGHRQPARNPIGRKIKTYLKKDDAVSDEHAHQIGDLPLVQYLSHVKGMLEEPEPSHGEQK